MKQDIENRLREQYRFINCLHKTEKSEVTLLEEYSTGNRIIKRVFTGKSDVYSKLRTLKHGNIPEVLEVAELGDQVLVLEEYIDGFTLSELLSESLYQENQVRTLVSELCDVLTFLHAHAIIHKDIKPDNIMIENSSQTLKLIDFDASRLYKKYYPRDTECLGTAGYAAPEQFSGHSDIRTDIKQVGELMKVMLTGETSDKIPYNGALSDIIAKCIHISPDKRFQTAEELKAALTGKRRSKAFPAFLSILLLAAVGIVIAVIPKSQKPEPLSLQKETPMTLDTASATQTTVQTAASTGTAETTEAASAAETHPPTTETITTTVPPETTMPQVNQFQPGDYITEGKTRSQIQGYGGDGDMGGIVLTMEEITDTTLTFSIVQYDASGLASDTVSARNITAEITGNTAVFEFSDMLGGKGAGSLTLENGRIHIETWGDTDRPTSMIVNEYLN